MDYPPPIYQQDRDIELRDRKEQANKNIPVGGYRDWESGAPHDPNHQAIPPPIVAPPQRRRVDISLWHIIALYGCCIFWVTTVIALIVVMATHLNCPVPFHPAGGLLNLNSSITTTVTVTAHGASQCATDAATMADITARTSASTTTVISSSSHVLNIVTAPTVTVNKVTISTAVAFSTTKTYTASAK